MLDLYIIALTLMLGAALTYFTLTLLEYIAYCRKYAERRTKENTYHD